MILLVLSVAGFFSSQVPSVDSTRQHLRVAVAVVGPTAGRERTIHESSEIEMARALQKSPFKVIRSSPPLLWGVHSPDMRVLQDTSILRELDLDRKLLRLDVLLAVFVIEADSRETVLGGAVYSEGQAGSTGVRFVGRGSTSQRAIRNLADVVAADLRRHATAMRAPAARRRDNLNGRTSFVDTRRQIRERNGAPSRLSSVCVMDNPHFFARAHWRWVRSATLKDVIALRASLGLADVPIDSITYERDEVKCARVVAALNAFRSVPDTMNRMREVTLVSWGGMRYIARLSGDDWAVFDSTQTFLQLLTTP